MKFKDYPVLIIIPTHNLKNVITSKWYQSLIMFCFVFQNRIQHTVPLSFTFHFSVYIWYPATAWQNTLFSSSYDTRKLYLYLHFCILQGAIQFRNTLLQSNCAYRILFLFVCFSNKPLHVETDLGTDGTRIQETTKTRLKKLSWKPVKHSVHMVYGNIKRDKHIWTWRWRKTSWKILLSAFKSSNKKTDRLTNRQTDRQTDRQREWF